jgi:catabolite repression protein CreC
VPSSSTLFLVSHVDGTIIVYDKERDDGIFTPQDPVQIPNHEPNDAAPPATQDNPPPVQQGEWDPLDKIFVTMPPWHPVPSVGGNGGKGDREKEKEREKDKVVKNPVSHWRVSRRSVVGERLFVYQCSLFNAISDFVFSPDVKYVAAIAEDGCLRVIDALAEQ